MDSFLSPEVRNLFSLACRGGSFSGCCDQYGFLSDEWLERFFGSVENEALMTANVPAQAWFETVIPKLGQGHFHEMDLNCRRWIESLGSCDERSKDSSGNQESNIWQNLEWLGPHVELLKRVVPAFVGCQKPAIYEAALILTASLERALGDVFHWKKPETPVPFLLRDVLASEAISEVFGLPMVRLLQVFLGSVKSLNVRNLLWHGYFLPSELPVFAFRSLLLAAATIGRSISNGTKIRRRPVGKTLPDFPDLENVEAFKNVPVSEVLRSLLKMDNPVVHPEVKDVWLWALELFEAGEWTRSVVTILPCVELLLRILFVGVHGGDETMLVAKLDEKYVIMDQMFAKDVAVVRNQLGDMRGIETSNQLMTETFSLGEANFLFDVYERLDGPRVRDVIGHFDCDSRNAVSDRLAKVVFTSAAIVLRRGLMKPVHYELQGNIEILDAFSGGYEPFYHPKHQLKLALGRVDGVIKELVDIISSEPETCNNLNLPEEIERLEPNGFPSYFKNTASVLTSEQSSKNGVNLLSEFSTLAKILKRKRLTYLFRPKRELELVNLLLNVIKLNSVIIENIRETLEERIAAFKARKLRSRQRETFWRMLESLATLCIGCRLTCAFATLCLLGFEYVDGVPVEKCLSVGKVCLKVAENNAANVRKDKNRWMEAAQLVGNELVPKLWDC